MSDVGSWNSPQLYRLGAVIGGVYAALAPNYAWFQNSRLAQFADLGGIVGAAVYSAISSRYWSFGFGGDYEMRYMSSLLGGAVVGAIIFGSAAGLRNLAAEN